VAYACTEAKKMGVLYSNSSCKHHCPYDEWLDDPSKIRLADWEQPQPLWNESTCHLRDYPAVVRAKIILVGSIYSITSTYPEKMAQLAAALKTGLHNAGRLVPAKDIMIRLGRANIFLSGPHPIVAEVELATTTSKVQNIVGALFGDAQQKATGCRCTAPSTIPDVDLIETINEHNVTMAGFDVKIKCKDAFYEAKVTRCLSNNSSYQIGKCEVPFSTPTAAENHLHDYITDGIAGVVRDLTRVAIVTNENANSIGGIQLSALDMLSYNIPGVTPGFITATTTTTTPVVNCGSAPQRQVVVEPPPVIFYPVPPTPPPIVSVTANEIDMAVYDGFTFYVIGGLYCFKIEPGASVYRVDWKNAAGEALLETCNKDTYPAQASTQISLGVFDRESYTHVYQTGKAPGCNGLSTVSIHTAEDASLDDEDWISPMKLTEKTPGDSCQLNLDISFYDEFFADLGYEAVQGELDPANPELVDWGEFSDVILFGNIHYCIVWKPGTNAALYKMESIARKTKSKCYRGDVKKFGDQIILGSYGYNRYAQHFNKGDITSCTYQRSAEVHFSKASDDTLQAEVSTVKDCSYLIDVKMPAWIQDVKPMR